MSDELHQSIPENFVLQEELMRSFLKYSKEDAIYRAKHVSSHSSDLQLFQCPHPFKRSMRMIAIISIVIVLIIMGLVVSLFWIGLFHFDWTTVSILTGCTLVLGFCLFPLLKCLRAFQGALFIVYKALNNRNLTLFHWYLENCDKSDASYESVSRTMSDLKFEKPTDDNGPSAAWGDYTAKIINMRMEHEEKIRGRFTIPSDIDACIMNTW